MDPSHFIYVLILLIINVIGARRIGAWNGSKIKKYIYRFTLFVLASFVTFHFARITSNMYMWRNPLPYILQFTIIFHLLIKRSAMIWIEMGLLPFSSNYPKKVKIDWDKMDFWEKYILGGLLVASSMATAEIPNNNIIFYLRIILFWGGILFVGYGSYLKFGVGCLIGIIFICIGLIITPIYSSIGVGSFSIGVLLVLLGYLNYKKKLSLLSISLKLMIIDIKDYFKNK
jgi:hypothetical protein